MPKLLFSKIWFSELKDLLPNVQRPRRIDIVLSQRRKKSNIWRLCRNDETFPSNHSWKTDHMLDLSLEKILRDKKYRALFRSFLKSEFSEENIDFWIACEDFRSTSDDLKWKAEKIYGEFIGPTACREINVDHSIREKIQKSLKKPSRSCFDEAQKHVFLLMLRDSCPRFLQSHAYLSLNRKSRTQWYI
ncbi:PREDICTED: regulator of G-protein signaling 1-like [Cyprinodon variegatus]|uniref:Regulator of G protein signaling 1 n=1 Tax=Cyprinodon variegatus TaxID=28743 RepID=A0A3Q2GLZ8_CYPVA|nr:PREDICTED: regulator of G-protein signaling 1-like [Cyprinodon variegatus]